MGDAKRDNNSIPTLLGVSSADGVSTVVLWADPTTHRLLVDLPSGAGDMTAAVYDAAGITEQLVGLTATQTLTNKTLTAPKIADAGFIADANGNEQIIFQTTASAVNSFEITNSIAGSSPTIAAVGDSANIGIIFQTKGDEPFKFKATASGPTILELSEDTSNGTSHIGISAPASLAGNQVLTLPDATDTLVGKATTDTLTNKSIDLANNTLTGTSAELATAISDETGSGLLVFATSPTLVTPALGTPASGDLTNCTASSVTQKGPVELATTAEIDTGTDSTRAIPVDQFVASKRNVRWLVFNLVEAATDCATATNIAGDFVSPIAGTILQSDTSPFYLYATNSTAGTTGTMVVDISIGGTSIMTTNKLDFDTTEKTTTTAATPPDLTTTALAVGDIITIDIDSIHTTASKGLTVYMAVRE